MIILNNYFVYTCVVYFQCCYFIPFSPVYILNAIKYLTGILQSQISAITEQYWIKYEQSLENHFQTCDNAVFLFFILKPCGLFITIKKWVLFTNVSLCWYIRRYLFLITRTCVTAKICFVSMSNVWCACRNIYTIHDSSPVGHGS